jgi:hypothetical protein
MVAENYHWCPNIFDFSEFGKALSQLVNKPATNLLQTHLVENVLEQHCHNLLTRLLQTHCNHILLTSCWNSIVTTC